MLIAIVGAIAQYQPATLSQQNRSIKTYPFGDPDPVPILVDNPKIYPYFKFEGYSHEGHLQDWKVVTLENEFLQVFVLPQAGGKVWGAIEKSTGKEFIYRNEVLKFRNIAMRGPWTSGGIEFNFGIIGHTPATATPVDYVVNNNADGSVECVVGAMDLPSRTQWRVKIRLPKDKAYFETEVLWYNPTPLRQSYYNWMTAAAFARPDLTFYCPGNQFLEHSGEARPWPVDEQGRHIDQYNNNQFASHKSYHVVGQHNDFFGGYYEKENWGFGHWAPYDEMPGKKLWLWSQARDGGIWEDLLTDTDGQYIEFQAGRMFVQYFPGDHVNPIKQAAFEPHAADTWREIWFPVKEIGGLTEVSEFGVMHLTHENSKLKVGINALSEASGQLSITSAGKLLLQKQVHLRPMEVVFFETDLPQGTDFDIDIAGMDLRYTTRPATQLARPFASDPMPQTTEAEKAYTAGIEHLEYREYEQARTALANCIAVDGGHQPALAAMAELEYRQGRYAEGLEWAQTALRINAYNPEANYTAGILYNALGQQANALEALGWAARSMAYRSSAYAQMSEIHLASGKHTEAIRYARLALDFNRYNLKAWMTMAIAYRQTGQTVRAGEALEAILQIDPLCHQARFEQYLAKKTPELLAAFQNAIGGEFPEQSYLELALDYYHKKQNNEALAVLELAARRYTHTEIALWHSFLQKDRSPEEARRSMEEALERTPYLVFPYRTESLPAWQWAYGQFADNWKSAWYLALNYWALGRHEEAWHLLKSCGQKPEEASFYLTRYRLAQIAKTEPPSGDLQRALQLNAGEWRTWDALINQQIESNQLEAALQLGKDALKKFPDNYTIGMDLVRAQVAAGRYEQAINQLKNLKVLPFELAYESRILYEKAHIGEALHLIGSSKWEKAISVLNEYKQWPEHLGVGRPYYPDERQADLLLVYCFEKSGNKLQAEAYKKAVITFSAKHREGPAFVDLLVLRLLSPPDAEILLGKLRGESAKGNWIARWVLDKYYNDYLDMEELDEALLKRYASDILFTEKLMEMK